MKIAYCDSSYHTSGQGDVNERILREDIKKALIALESAYCGFDYATDPDMIDCHIFRINSALKRYRYLLLQAESLHENREDNMPPREESKFQTTITIPATTPVNLYEVTP